MRYHLRRQEEGAVDGRSLQVSVAAGHSEAIGVYLATAGGRAVNLAALHDWLVSEQDYQGSLRSLQRYFRRRYPQPKKRARRRVETPPGAQAQADWAEWSRVWIAGRPVKAYEFHLRLSYSRFGARDALQVWTDEVERKEAGRRVCPATGESVLSAWEEEKPQLAPVPLLPEPFDVAVPRKVADDCTVAFEGRRYSVPFRYLARRVELRGCARRVQVSAEGQIVADHPRRGRERIVIDPHHYEGEATESILPPVPLGRFGRRLAEIADLSPERRPLDLYAALAEVAR